MKQLPAIDADDIVRLAPVTDAIEALRDAFAAQPVHIARSAHPTNSSGELLVMPAIGDTVAGVKLLVIQPANAQRGRPVIQGTYVLFDTDLGEPVALLDGAALTTVRTPAVSALATDVLARTNVRTLGIVGTGPQAVAHARAMLVVRSSITEIVVAGRSDATARAAVAAIAADVRSAGIVVRVGSIEHAADCDIVCTVTRSTEPIVTRAMVRRGTHVNAVGAYRNDMRELSSDLVAASRVFVDELHAARDEAGDLTLAVADGSWSWVDVAGDLADLCAGRARRRDDGEITVFESVGLALEDLVVAHLVAARMGFVDPIPKRP